MNKKILSMIGTLCWLMFLVISIGLGYGQQKSDSSADITVKDPVYKKGQGPIVLFDEGHNNFHTSTGRYKPFVDVVLNDGYVVVINTSRFTGDVLKDHRILVISNALEQRNVKNWKEPFFPAFMDEEINVVHKWVKEGGALLLIADHSPFGAAAFNLAKKFGVTLSNGTARDPSHRVQYTRENGKLLDHPISLGRNESEKLNRVMTFAGESLQVPEGTGFLQLSDKAIDIHPVSKEKRPVPGHFQGAAFGYGKGRIVVLGEAGMLTAQKVVLGSFKGDVVKPFGMNVSGPGNKRFLLNIMHYLSGLLEPGIVVSGCPSNQK